MADAVNAATRNLHPRHSVRNGLEYRDGRGYSYTDQQTKLSWPIPTDVPSIGQASAMVALPELKATGGFKDSTQLLHPMTYTKMHHTDHLSFTKSMTDLGVGLLGDRKLKVHERLYLGSRSVVKTGTRAPQGQFEVAADIAFKNGDAHDAVNLYTKAIMQASPAMPNMFAYEKRCAALAEVGRYGAALKDAEFIMKNSEGRELGAAMSRVKTIKDYMKRMNNFDAGYHNATSTLVCLLRPREHRQLVQSNPSTYGRPKSALHFGRGLTSSASVGSLLSWDKDNDGNIDVEEFRAGVAALGYDVHKKEKSIFKGSGSRGFI